MKIAVKLTTLLLVYVLMSTQILITGQNKQTARPKYPDISKGRGRSTKGIDDAAKLSPELRLLYAQYKKRGKSSRGDDKRPIETEFSERQLKEFFGIDSKSANPMVSISITLASNSDISALKKVGMKVYMRKDEMIFGQAPVLSLGNITEERYVKHITAAKSVRTPELPKQPKLPPLNVKTGSKATIAKNSQVTQPLANEFNKANLTGKGVIVGVIDTGIDWRHPDFIKPDGTSRILAIWDFFDTSFAESDGKIGSAPPQLDPESDPLWGTVYTQEQINAALKGKGTVNTMDNYGHGTAVAGTAVGKTGVAPEADLIIIKAADCGFFDPNYLAGTEWMVQKAKELKRPIVINKSFGGHFSAHTGAEFEEEFLNRISGKGMPGVVFTVSAGNEGQFSMHGAGRFGPRKEGQVDIASDPLSLIIPLERTGGSPTILLGIFDARDEWGVYVQPIGQTVLLDANTKPISFYIFKVDGELKYMLDEGLTKPWWFDEYMQEMLFNYSQLGEKTDQVGLILPFGAYQIYGFGATENVVNGNFDFYAPQYYAVDFGIGTSKTGMVGSPGNATNAITVGAYNFRSSWVNSEGTETFFNLTSGEISDYSSPGGRRRADNIFKPDIAAPATYTISPLSQAAKPEGGCQGYNMGAGLGERFITSDGQHIAWSGTSASAPFTAGVIALMLQKKSNLDAEQVRQILIKTAKKGGLIGAVPNPNWGYGMLDPAAALKAVPLPKKPKK